MISTKMCLFEELKMCKEHDKWYAEYGANRITGEPRNTFARSRKEIYGHDAPLDCVDFEELERKETMGQIKAFVVLVVIICISIAAIKL